ncbi:LANO_0H13366g1_1 [Lachancea nothofagi CBS 11611]|uniref:Endoplasmic reticulum transmembrane protein n=1 Tax=Lachancea nothofagi CBS 11611 TaxID=1266666 RepID=A0A1G4KMI5_9SACH|nr:LANO_0H13366g1_1 [Lachancea nothofagi CBS 11611]
MSVYLSVLFAMLTTEMACLFLLVLPLHYKIRKAMASTYFRLMSYTQVKTVIAIVGGLVGLLFVDSWKRSQITVSLHHHQVSAGADPNGSGSVTSVQALASRAYNQRNIYISGFILYFAFCIPTVISVVRRLVKYETLIREKASNESGPNGEKSSGKDREEDAKVVQLREELAEKKASIKALERQKASLEAHFDKTTKPKGSDVLSAEEKKGI